MRGRFAGMLTLASALAIGIAIQGPMAAQQPKKPDAEVRKEAKRGGGADPNITKTREQVTKAPTQMPAPGEKTGETSRQRICRLVFDNYTRDWIDAYADGAYRGQVPPYGELYTYVISGPTVAYASASDGSGTWGPARFACNAEYWWRLRP